MILVVVFKLNDSLILFEDVILNTEFSFYEVFILLAHHNSLWMCCCYYFQGKYPHGRKKKKMNLESKYIFHLEIGSGYKKATPKIWFGSQCNLGQNTVMNCSIVHKVCVYEDSGYFFTLC